MGVGEYALAFVTVVLGLAVSDLLLSLHKLLRAWRRVTWDWLTPLLGVMMLFAAVLFWWLCYVWFAGLQTLSIIAFLPKLAFLAVNVLMIVSVFPDEVPEQGIDLRTFYFDSRVHVWSLVTIGFVLSIAVNMIDRGLSEFDSFQPYGALSLSLLLSVIALWSRKVWVQVVSILGIIAIQIPPFLLFVIHSPAGG